MLITKQNDVQSNAKLSHSNIQEKKPPTDHSTQKINVKNVEVEISPEAQSKAKSSEKVDYFLKNNGEALFNKTIKSMKQYPKPLSFISKDTSIPKEERLQANKEMNKREHEAFMKYGKMSPPDMKMYYQKYIEYLDSLSPEEQNSWRYKGQREIAVSRYEHHCYKQGEKPEDMTYFDPILSLFELLDDYDFNPSNTDRLVKEYNEKVGSLFEREATGQQYKNEAETALSQLTLVKNLILQAREGSEEAMSELNFLAK